jgi:hypothetical protein
MSRATRRVPVVMRQRTFWSRLRRFAWRLLRGFVLLGAAMGPGMPPPPPPPPAQTEQVADSGDSLEEE